jgi:hypothetical protein
MIQYCVLKSGGCYGILLKIDHINYIFYELQL